MVFQRLSTACRLGVAFREARSSAKPAAGQSLPENAKVAVTLAQKPRKRHRK